MNTSDLKAYLTRAKELEAAIFTQKELNRRFQEYIATQKPTPPQKNEAKLHEPHKPQKVSESLGDLFFYLIFSPWLLFTIMFLLCLIVVIGNIIAILDGIYLNPLDSDEIILPVLFVSISVFAFLVYVVFLKIKYKKDIVRYNKQFSEYKSELSTIESAYADALNIYQAQLSTYTTACSEFAGRHIQLIGLLSSALEAHYAANVIFPKYRNFVAVAAICEYLESGRCSTLEGIDGAYNLYEMEQIRGGHYSFNQEIHQANQTVSAILEELRDVHEATRLTAWFAGVTALAETSPTYISIT